MFTPPGAAQAQAAAAALVNFSAVLLAFKKFVFFFSLASTFAPTFLLPTACFYKKNPSKPL